jgi:hypothetical protein
MNSARSAKVLGILGATLIATSISAVANAGIHTGSVNGIHTGSVNGIHSGSVNGIHTGSVNGIHTGSVNGIHTGSVNGIHTGSVNGIHTGSVNGIHTGSVNGIHTGSVNGIHTGSVNGIHTGSVNGIHTGSIKGDDAIIESQLVLSAPVSSVDAQSGIFRAMGQTILVSTDVAAVISVGDYVSVYGTVAGPGYLYADVVFFSSDQYVPGVSEIIVSGMISSVDRSLGLAKIGELTIDYTQSLATGEHPDAGLNTFRGVQAQSGSHSLLGEPLFGGAIH